MIANHKGEIPFITLLIPFLLGIGLGLGFLPAIPVIYLTYLLLSLAVIFIILNLNYKRFNLYKITWLGGSLMWLILLLLGWVSIARYSELNNSKHFSKTQSQYLLVTINNEPVIKADIIRFTAAVKQQVTNGKASPAKGTILISIKDSLASQLYYGDELLIPAKFTLVDPPHNPAEFNYKKYLANQNIHYQQFLYSKQYVVINKNAGNKLIAYSLNLRRQLVEKFKRNMHDTSAIAVASTLILGYKADLSNDILQAYSKTGTIHILSVSGGHVAIIYILLGWIFGFLNGYWYGRLFKAVIIITLIWYYSLLTGFSPAACRAAVMISMIIIGKTYSRYINQLNILAVSAFFMLLYNPYFITDVGFQLSYLAVGGLVVFQPMIYKWLTFKNWLANQVWMACSVSIAAQVITFPLSAFYFHQFPVYFLLSNLIIAIPVIIIMYIGLAYLVLPQIPFISAALGYVLERCILLMNKILVVIEHSPFASIGKIWLTTFEYMLAYAIIICAFYFIFNKNTWLLKVSLGLLLVLSVSISVKRISAANNNTITFLNLKKHRGIVFKQGEKAIILADILPTDKNYNYSIQPGLDSNKIIDTVLYNLADNVNTPHFRKAGNLIQFQNKRLLIVDKQLPRQSLSPKLKVDYLYLTSNPRISIDELNKNYTYNLLVIDASNTDKVVNNLNDQLKNTSINYQILKRNNSLSVASN